MRTITGVLIGLAFATLAIFLATFGAHYMFPDVAAAAEPGAVANPTFEDVVTTLPHSLQGLAALLAGWAVGSFLGAYVADFVGGRARAGWIVGAAAAICGVMLHLRYDPPGWLIAGLALLPLAAAAYAHRAARLPF